MLDFLEGYLDNISAAATQAVANGDPLSELSASLWVSVDTVTAQAKEIKILHQYINALKKKGNPNQISGTNAGVGMTGNVCPHCATVGSLDPHKQGSGYFDTKKITEGWEWVCALMNKRVVAHKEKY